MFGICARLTAGVCAALAASCCAFAASVTAPYRPGVVLVSFRQGTSPSEADAAVARASAARLRSFATGVFLLKVAEGSEDLAIRLLKANGRVRYAEPDYLMGPLDDVRGAVAGGPAQVAPPDALPNDSYLPMQWAARNTGQTVNGATGTAGADERLAPAWSVSGGTNTVVVAVLDTGVQYSHPDLVTNLWINPGGIGGCPAGTYGYNVLTGTCDPMDDDTNYAGHGSHVAGIIGAVANNAAGVAGVNWAVSIMPVKWVSATGGNSTSDLITAMDWVIKAKQAGVNVRVANDSPTFPGTAFSQALSDELDLLAANDILFVTPAGNTAQNNDSTPRYPCSYNRPEMLCVAATDQNDNLWSSSNYGTTTVQLGAPGVNIISTLRSSNYGYINGSSMSAAEVSGTAALILSQGYMSVSALRSAILTNVDPLPSLTNFVSTGGRLNACKALPGCTSAVAGVPVSTAAPGIAGSLQYGSLLGTSIGNWSGVPAQYSYQWYRCGSTGSNCAAIPGATSSNYALLASADVGATLRVTVTAANPSGSGANQSAASGVILPATSPFGIGSTIQDGQTISGGVKWQATPSPTVNFVQFYIDGVLSQTAAASPYIYNGSTTGLLDSTTLANGTHVLGIRALASDNRTYGFLGATITVANGTNLPVNTTLPVISGAAEQGATLSTSNGVWSGSPTAYAYQWRRCDTTGANCTAVAGATGSTYALTSADIGFTVRSSVTATNAAGSSTASSAPTAVVVAAVTVSTTSLPNAVLGSAYTATLAASGGTAPYSWSVTSGSVPPGMTLSPSTGVISGTPTASGTFAFTAQVSDGNSRTASKALSITVGAGDGGVGITLLQSNAVQGAGTRSVSLPFAAANTAGNLIIAFVRMSTTSQTVALTDTAGNSYVDAVSQAQTADGHQIHILYAQNIKGGANTVTAAFSATNNHPWLAIYEYSGLSKTNPLDQTAHAQGSSASPSTGLTGTTSSTTELLFAGVGLVSNYSGTVTAGAGFTLQMQNTASSRAANEAEAVTAAGSYSGTFSLSAATNWSAVVATFAAASQPVITTSSLPGAVQGTAYSYTLAASGGAPPYTWSIVSGSLPAGLTLAAATGVISGTPASSGTSSFTVQVTDAASHTATKALSIAVTASGGGGGIALMQSNSVQGSGVASVSAAFPAANTAGNLIVAFVRMSTTSQTVSVTDTAGNIYTDAVAQAQTTDGHQVHIFYAKSINGGANTVTAAFSATNNHPWLAVYEYSGLSKTNPLDRTAHAQGSGSTASSGATATTSSANELVFAGLGLVSNFTGTVTPGAGFTLQLQNTATSRAATETSVVSATGSYTGTFSLSASTNWSCALATFTQ